MEFGPVLLVEDDDMVLAAMQRALIAAGLLVVQAQSASDALAAAEQDEQWTAFLIDVQLRDGGRAGLDLLSMLRARWREVPAAVITGLWDREIAARANELGAVYILKGDDFRALETFLALLRPPPPVIGLPMMRFRERVSALGFTPTEMAVAECIARDGNPAEFCAERGMTPRTFRAHSSNGLAKTGARSWQAFLSAVAFRADES